jgi:hypothetical protein
VFGGVVNPKFADRTLALKMSVEVGAEKLAAAIRLKDLDADAVLQLLTSLKANVPTKSVGLVLHRWSLNPASSVVHEYESIAFVLGCANRSRTPHVRV